VGGQIALEVITPESSSQAPEEPSFRSVVETLTLRNHTGGQPDLSVE
jgi:hypothetical protein